LACGLPAPLWVDSAIADWLIDPFESALLVFVGLANAEDAAPKATATAEAIRVLRIMALRWM
jgi:hypothetical protein